MHMTEYVRSEVIIIGLAVSKRCYCFPQTVHQTLRLALLKLVLCILFSLLQRNKIMPKGSQWHVCFFFFYDLFCASQTYAGFIRSLSLCHLLPYLNCHAQRCKYLCHSYTQSTEVSSNLSHKHSWEHTIQSTVWYKHEGHVYTQLQGVMEVGRVSVKNPTNKR